ncbi:glycosyltransferase family 2 protein [Shigella sonnei]|nr:glycosyltransferase family 2 protein [Shigella sonnei]
MSCSAVKLSIVIPAYNASKTIVSTLKSFESSISTTYEVIIVDDCSCDNTIDIIKRYSASKNNIHLIQMDINSGPGVARDKGLEIAKGEYTIFFDSDDMMRPRAVDNAIKHLEENNLSVAIMRYAINFGANGKDIGMWERDSEIYNEAKERYGSIIDVYQYPRFISVTNYPWTKICRTDFLRNNNIQFGSLRLHEDIIPHWMIIMNAEKIYLSDDIVCDYMLDVNGQNVTNNNTSLRLQCITASESLYEILSGNIQYTPFLKEYWPFLACLLEWAISIINDNDKSTLQNLAQGMFRRLSFEELTNIKYVDRQIYNTICKIITE